jgi:hypothetical protein
MASNTSFAPLADMNAPKSSWTLVRLAEIRAVRGEIRPEPIPPREVPMSLTRMVAVAVTVSLVGMAPLEIRAAEDTFLDRFKGTWTGSGQVQRNAATNPWHVNCTAIGNRESDRISIQGNCHAALIIQRRIGAELTYDPRSGIYRGIYTGARVGPARLSGRRNGDAVHLTIDWPKPVNGDTHAEMTIHNEGTGVLRIVVRDNLQPGGPVQQTSDLVLRQR